MSKSQQLKFSQMAAVAEETQYTPTPVTNEKDKLFLEDLE